MESPAVVAVDVVDGMKLCDGIVVFVPVGVVYECGGWVPWSGGVAWYTSISDSSSSRRRRRRRRRSRDDVAEAVDPEIWEFVSVESRDGIHVLHYR